MSNLMILEEGSSTTQVAGQTIVASYGNDEAAREAFAAGAALVNRSHAGLIRLTGGTRQKYLHNQTTNHFNRLKAGESTDAVFVTSTARTIDLVTAIADDESICMITSPERHTVLLNWMPRFVFFLDDVQFKDEKGNYAVFSLLGPQSGALLATVGAEAIVGQPAGRHLLLSVAGVDGVRVVVGGGLVGEGYTLLVPANQAADVWQALRGAGAEPMGDEVWESLRIEQGRPAADRELTEEHNPLESGLWEVVSFNKGCYIGQEIIARLDTYQKLKKQLWGLRLSAPVELNSPVLVKNKEVGRITSVTDTPSGPFGLAYIRTKAGGAGLSVQVGDASAEVVDLPYLTRKRSDI